MHVCRHAHVEESILFYLPVHVGGRTQAAGFMADISRAGLFCRPRSAVLDVIKYIDWCLSLFSFY